MKRLILLLITLLPFTLNSQQVVFHLTGQWQLHSPDTAISVSATVPGNVFIDLTKAGIIPDPFYGQNEQKVQWVSQKKWIYEKNFFITSKFLKHKNIELIFDGIYPFASVYINGKLVIKADNMFRRWQVNVKHLLLKGNNSITVKFAPPLVYDSILAQNFPYKLPDSRVFARSAAFQYGWDWGARLIPVGIWQNVYLQAWDKAQITDLYVRTESLNKSLAAMSALIDINAQNRAKVTISLQCKEYDVFLSKTTLRLHKGLNHIVLPFYIANPRLWWPRGMGKQNLYHFMVKVQGRNINLSKSLRTGLRQIELVQKSDSIGRSFYFRVNGHRIFVHGANYIPQDQFPSRVSDSQYIALLNDVYKANINMLRVWGGGIYEKDKFYDLCDSLGILVWQDFMFACYFYPFDNDFVKNTGQEAIYQVRRLRNHPSIALWCGNNEVKEAWYNWGYQKLLRYSKNDSIKVWHGQQLIFDSLLSVVVDSLSPDVPYVPTSPQTGWGHKEAYNSGDVHYWGVWWAGLPFEAYLSHVGRFMSEYGFQAFPDLRTLRAVLPDSSMNLHSSDLLNHEKHPRGMQLIHSYMARYLGVPKDFDDYVYYSQLLQAYGIGIAIKAHRTAKPRCMGTMYWQLNDSWPVISWSSRDYYGRWKALQYQVRRLYKTVIITSLRKNNQTEIYVVSDSTDKINACVTIQLWDTRGRHTTAIDTSVTIYPDTSQKIISLSLSDIDTTKQFFAVYLTDSRNHAIDSSTVLLSYPKYIDFQRAKINVHSSKVHNYYLVTLQSDYPVYKLQLLANTDGFFSDNFLSLLPNRKYTVRFYPRDAAQNAQFRFRFYLPQQ